MQDSTDLLKLIKRIVVETVNANKPTEFQYGTVTSIKPLEIKINQKITIDEDLIANDIKQSVICKDLKKDEKVILLRNQGGQEFVILDVMKKDEVVK